MKPRKGNATDERPDAATPARNRTGIRRKRKGNEGGVKAAIV